MDGLLLALGAGVVGVGGWLSGRLYSRRFAAAPTARPNTTGIVGSEPPELAWIARANGARAIWLRRSGGGPVSEHLLDRRLEPGLRDAILARLSAASLPCPARRSTRPSRAGSGALPWPTTPSASCRATAGSVSDAPTSSPSATGKARPPQAAMARVEPRAGALIVVDLDHFKSLNDALGHPAGDSALEAVAAILEDAVRGGADTAARIGGEEFAVWLPDTGLAKARTVAERLRASVSELGWSWQGREWPLTASIGVAGWPETTRSRENLFAQADAALYRAKADGRNRVEVAAAE